MARTAHPVQRFTRCAETRPARPSGSWLVALLIATAAAAASPSALARPRSEPADALGRTAGDLHAARRCLDERLAEAGVQEIALAVDSLADTTRPGDDTTREAAIVAFSEVGARSRALRVGAVGRGEAGWARLLLRGALRAEGGDGRVLTLELSVLDARDRSTVAGASSRQTVRVQPPAEGREGRIEFRKFGTPYSLRMPADGHPSAAARVLLDLGAIETTGRLGRVAYWRCLGGSADHPEVLEEVQDWYDGLAARPAELIRFFQQRLRHLRIFAGAVDGVASPALREAVARTREALGLGREPKLSLELFRALLEADGAQLTARLAVPAPASAEAPAPSADSAPAGSASGEPLGLRLATAGETQRMARDEPLRLTVQPSRDAHVYCFHQDEHRRIRRFFPNRFQPDSRIRAEGGVQLPGSMPFEIVMNARGATESVTCLATGTDVLDRLPPALTGQDFDVLGVASVEQLRDGFARATGGRFVSETRVMRPR